MAVVNTFKDGGTGVLLTGANPTPDYAGQLIGKPHRRLWLYTLRDGICIRRLCGFACADLCVVQRIEPRIQQR